MGSAKCRCGAGLQMNTEGQNYRYKIQKKGNGRCAAANERIQVRYCCCLSAAGAQVRACAVRPVEQPPCSLAFASPHRSPIAVPHSLSTASSPWTLQNTRKLCTSAAQNSAWHAGFIRAVGRVIRSKTVARPRLTLRHQRTTHASSTLHRP
jgi:hypothetical protein